MTDVIDDAQRVTDLMFDVALARQLDRQMFGDERQERHTGHCAGCGDHIDPERLAALPGVRRCLECQEARERRERGL